MKKTVKTLALLSILSIMALGCQKDILVKPIENQIVQSNQQQTFVYFIDGSVYRTTISGDTEMHNFIAWMLTLARNGHNVCFYNESVCNSNSPATKEVVTHKTKDEEDANNWATMMTNRGYIVKVDFDEVTGIYTCTAIR